MPANISLFFSVSEQKLLAGLGSSTSLDPSTLPLFYGDTVSVQVYLLQKNPTQTNPLLSSYTSLPAAGLSLELFLDNGVASPTIYAQQVAWTLDATGTFFSATVSLFTPALQALFAAAPSATSLPVYLQVGYIQGGLPTTVYSKPVTLTVGIPPTTAPLVPANQTAISLETARTLFVPINGKPNGQPFYQTSPAGHTFVYQIVDNADGTASVQCSQIN